MSELDENVDDLSVEEIESRLDRLGMVVNYPDAIDAVAEDEPVKEETPEEVAAEEKPDTEVEAKPEAEAGQESETEVTQDDHIKAALEELEAKAKHWESVAGRHAGELGFVKQQLAKLQEASRRVEPDESVDDHDESREPVRTRQPKSDNLATWAVSQAVSQAASSFWQGHSDMQELQEDVANYLKNSGYDSSTVMLTDDPIAAARETTRVLEEAYLYAKAQRASSRREELKKISAEQTNKLAEAKRKAAVSASSSVPPPKPKPKSPNEMSLEEIEAEMLRQTGGRW